MSKIEEIADDVLVLSDIVPVDERISWIPAGSQGFESFNEFIILNSDHALLIDTGVALHGPSIVASLRQVLGKRELVIFTTRSEPDSLGNLSRILHEFPKSQVVTTSPLRPPYIVHLLADRRPDSVPSTRARFGDRLTQFGFARIALVDPVIRLLGTTWLVDHRSATLFTSDFFGADLLQRADEPVIRPDGAALPDAISVRRSILAKFDWLARADTRLLETRWSKFFGGRSYSALAPARGRVQCGPEHVQRFLNVYRTAAFDRSHEYVGGH
jgi:flavorubredoxin